MRAIFEDIKRRHCSSAEAMDEECFELTLGEVETHDEEGEGLQGGWAEGVLCVGEDEVEEGVD